MALTLYNTKTKQKEVFTPQTQGHVSMYHCGPTVYNYAHIGNLRQYIFADVLRRTLEWLGYEVTQVINITNVGHLTSDGDEGEDKMTKALAREEKEMTIAAMEEIGERYASAFIEDLSFLNIRTPHHTPRASKHINADIDIITKLEEKGFTYTTNDGVYFDTEKLPTYGKLGGLTKETNDAQQRVESNSEKKHPRDFALWKFNDSLGWESPWGQGFPGWHIECSGMSMEYLGETLDIHTGGIDHIPVHHNNEIAQSETATGKEFAHFWLHGAFLTVAGEKVAKSVGNVVFLHHLLENGYHPLAYRYLILQAHYRSPLSFSWEALEQAQQSLSHLLATYTLLTKETDMSDAIKSPQRTQWVDSFTEAITDDLNTPQALSVIHEAIGDPQLNKQDKLLLLQLADEVLGVGLAHLHTQTTNIPTAIEHKNKERAEARKRKDWKQSDQLRDKIQQAGFHVYDLPNHTILQETLFHLAQKLSEATHRT